MQPSFQFFPALAELARILITKEKNALAGGSTLKPSTNRKGGCSRSSTLEYKTDCKDTNPGSGRATIASPRAQDFSQFPTGHDCLRRGGQNFPPFFADFVPHFP
jgi:hypothetical protein